MILGLFGCPFGLLLPFLSYSVFFQIKYDEVDDDEVGDAVMLEDFKCILAMDLQVHWIFG